MSNKVEFVIQITQQYKIQCSYIDSQNKETIIKLNTEDKETEFYSTCISIQQSQIIISQEENNKAINFMKDLFEQPDEFKYYQIDYNTHFFKNQYF